MPDDKSYDAMLIEIGSRKYTCDKCGKVGTIENFSVMRSDGSGVCTLCIDLNDLKIYDKALRANIAEYYLAFDRSCWEKVCDAKHCLFCPEFWRRIKQDKGITVF